MPENKYLKVSEIKLDLKNYRTMPQKSEIEAINAMIAIKSERFQAIIESVIESGYIPTENLIILHDADYIVKEGNRRAAALKLAQGIYDIEQFSLPASLKQKIRAIGDDWKKENCEIPCNVYKIEEKDKVDKIVNLTHAKGEKASRDPWTSVAKARQNRDEKNGPEPALDLLEKYLVNGRNITNQQKERWSGEYAYTVLVEALRFLYGRLGFTSIQELSNAYPDISHRDELETVLRAIGLEELGFKEIRDAKVDFALNFGFPPLKKDDPKETGNSSSGANGSSDANQENKSSGKEDHQNNSSNSNQANTNNPVNDSHDKANGNPTQTDHKSSGNNTNTKAYSIIDQKYITYTLKKFQPKGDKRQKIVSLRDELKKLKVKENPIAFCFLLRSIFEISATIYSEDNLIDMTIPIGQGKTKQKSLQQILSSVTEHLTDDGKNKAKVKILHGANTELGKPEGLLSVTSMNQLVHNPTFSIAPHDICTLFNNIYPLLEEMN